MEREHTMKINMQSKKLKNFSELKCGDVFQFEQPIMLYMKTESSMMYGNRLVNTICLNNGFLYFVPNEKPVIPIDGEYVVAAVEL